MKHTTCTKQNNGGKCHCRPRITAPDVCQGLMQKKNLYTTLDLLQVPCSIIPVVQKCCTEMFTQMSQKDPVSRNITLSAGLGPSRLVGFN